MDQILVGVPAAYCYMDDILLASPDHSTHKEDLRMLLAALREYGLVLNIEKCSFAQSAVDFLGHRITAEGATPLESHVAAVQDFPQPATVQGLQGFLGMVNFYRRFLPGLARTLLPLTDALKGGVKGASIVSWTADMVAAFIAAKAALCAATTLVHPDPAADISIMVDASATHVGAVLQQRRQGAHLWDPLGFFSKKLDAAQINYSAFDREMWAIFSGIRYFRYMLEGRRFTVFTDHKPLITALRRQSEPWTAKQQRQLSYIAEYTSDLQHVAGVANVVADTLSRPAAAVPASSESPPRGPVRARRGDNAKINQSTTSGGLSSGSSPSTAAQPPSRAATGPLERTYAAVTAVTQPGPAQAPATSTAGGSLIDFTAVAAGQAGCADTQAALASSSLQTRVFTVEGVDLWCDISTGAVRPLVPVSHRRLIFNALHSLAHPAARATRRLISSRFVWRGMSRDVAEWCKDCQSCARGKVTRHVHSPVQPIAIPDRRFSHIHVDLVGPLPPSAEGFTHILTIIDRSTRWAEAVPMRSTTAVDCANSVIAAWVSRFGVPDVVTSDRGPQFTSAVWAVLCDKLNILHLQTTAYHPQSNGMVERFHRQLKDALRARECGAEWAAHLPWALLGLRAAPKEDSAISSAELVYGSPLRLPGQLPDKTAVAEGTAVPPAVRAGLPTRLQQSGGERAPPAVPAALSGATHVYIRRGNTGPPLTPLYSGPYVVRRREPKFFTLIIGGKHETVSVERLKAHRGVKMVSPASPPPRGRPPKTAARQS